MTASRCSAHARTWPAHSAAVLGRRTSSSVGAVMWSSWPVRPVRVPRAGISRVGFRLIIENMPHRIRSLRPGHLLDTHVEVLAAVFTVRPEGSGQQRLHVLLWQRARDPDAGRWALPGGLVLPDEDVDDSAARQLAEKVDLTRVAHLEQIGVFSAPHRVPDARVVATGFLGLVPLDADPQLPGDTAWHPVDNLPPTALDHRLIVDRAHRRLQAKLSYTNIGFALAPAQDAL